MSQEFYIAPASASANRVALLPTKGSEDVSAILGRVETASPLKKAQGPKEYLPRAAVEWVVETGWKDDVPRATGELKALLMGIAWSRVGNPTCFGKDAATGLWTYLLAGNGPIAVTEVRLAWRYFESSDVAAKIADHGVFEERLERVKQLVSGLDGGRVRAEVEPLAAANRSAMLGGLSRRLAGEVSLRLKAPFWKNFDGVKVWDVMMCLGLTWGDMDLFHWQNDSAHGDTAHFSVWTTTAPGYFLPEQAASGRLRVEDLVFGFVVGRSANPEAVLRGMFAAADYARKRLGGTIEDRAGKKADQMKMLGEVRLIAEELRSAGFEPGASEALMLL